MTGAIALATAALTGSGAQAEMIEIAAIGADGVIVGWFGAGEGRPDVSMRAAVRVTPARVLPGGNTGTYFGDTEWLPMEASFGIPIGDAEMELTQLKASLLRTSLVRAIPIELLTIYRDLDRGIVIGGDLLGIQIPINILETGEIVLLPGMEIGVRHYGADVDTTAFHASFTMDVRAAVLLLDGWLKTGLLNELRLEAVTGGMSGVSNRTTGFMSIALDSDNRMYVRVYSGVDYESARPRVDLPETNWFVGAGMGGHFGP